MQKSGPNILQLLSLAIALYLLFYTLSGIDIAATQNKSLLYAQQIEVDTLQDIHKVKLLAKSHLETIKKIRQQWNTDSNLNAGLLILLLIIQIIVFTNRRTQNRSSEKSV